MVIHLSCSSFLVSVARVSPAFALAIIPAFDNRESVKVDLPWSTWAITDMFRILCFLSIIVRISSTVKFTWKNIRPLMPFLLFHQWNRPAFLNEKLVSVNLDFYVYLNRFCQGMKQDEWILLQRLFGSVCTVSQLILSLYVSENNFTLENSNCFLTIFQKFINHRVKRWN